MARKSVKKSKTRPVRSSKKPASEEHNILAALSYLIWPLALILIVVEETKKSKVDRHLRHHAYNAMGFAIAWFILWLIIEAFSRLLFVVLDLTQALFGIAIVIIALIFAYRAYKGQEVMVPFVTPFLKKNIKGF